MIFKKKWENYIVILWKDRTTDRKENVQSFLIEKKADSEQTIFI